MCHPPPPRGQVRAHGTLGSNRPAMSPSDARLTLVRPSNPVDDDGRVDAGLVFVAHQREAGGIDQIALAVRNEGAGAGQIFLTVGAFDDEEAATVDRQVAGRGG